MLPSRIFFDNFFDDLDVDKKGSNLMQCDIYEKDDKYNIEMDVPGFKKEDINIELHNGYLIISAKKTTENNNDDDKNYIRRERYSTKCERQFYVGDISEDEINASFKNGELIISIPKESKQNSKKTINID